MSALTLNLYIGSHVSTRGGYSKAAQRAFDMGANAFQYFPKNPRGLRVKKFDMTEAMRCKAFCIKYGLRSIAHSPYPTNPALGRSKGDSHYQGMIASLQNDLHIAEACGSAGVVVHFGHVKMSDPLVGYRHVIQFLDDVLTGWEGKSKILIENQAGDHGPMGTTIEEMVQIRNLSRYADSIGFCLDTCHAYASGLWNGSEDPELLEKGQSLGYFDALVAIHVNDSKYGYRSNKDRHERVGKGYIGEKGLAWLLQQKDVKGSIWVLETETGEDGTHQEDIELIRTWLT